MSRTNQSNDDVRSARKFGAIFAVLFAIIGLLPILKANPLRWWAVAIAVAFAVLALLVPASLQSANRLWLRFGLALHHVTNPIIIGVIYYLAVLPTALVLRAFHKDFLHLQPDEKASSHWISRDPAGPSNTSMTKQF